MIRLSLGSLTAAVLIALVAGACTDATIELDGGSSKDTGVEEDAGSVADTGIEPDAGVDEDAGCPLGFATVYGSITRTYFSHLEAATEPVNLENESLAAVIPRDDGTFLRFEGATGPDGTFTIRCVPDGPYYLEYDRGYTEYRVTSSRRIQIQRYARGTLNPPRPSGSNTRLAFDVAGLEPWEPEDRLELWTTHQKKSLSELESGATRFQHAVRLLADDALIDASRGERAALVQWSNLVSAGGQPVRAITRIFEPPPFTAPDEQTTNLTGTSRPVDTRTITIDWRVAELAAVSSSAALPVVAHELVVSSLPSSATAHSASPYLGGPRSTPVFFTWTGTVSPSLITELEVPVVFPDNRLVMTVGTVIEAPGGLRILPALLSVPLDASDTGPILLAPRIGPPRNLRVDGRDASGPLSGVGLTPTLTWDPPSVGQAAVYEGVILNLDTSAVTTFQTQAPRFVLPPGVLTPGAAHLIELSAHTTQEPRALSAGASLTFVWPLTP